MPESTLDFPTSTADLAVNLSDGVLSVTINRPDSLNSLTAPVIAGLADTMESAATDPRVQVVRLGGAGRGFCSGAGISADDMSGGGGVPPDEIIVEVNRLIRAITALPHPVVAVVQDQPRVSAFPSPWPATSYWLRRQHFSCLPSPRSD